MINPFMDVKFRKEKWMTFTTGRGWNQLESDKFSENSPASLLLLASHRAVFFDE